MLQNTDTTIWSGAGFVLSLIASWEQALIAIFSPVVSWIMLHYAKKLVVWIETKRNKPKELK